MADTNFPWLIFARPADGIHRTGPHVDEPALNVMGFINLANFIDSKTLGDTAQIKAHPFFRQHDAVSSRFEQDILIIYVSQGRCNFFIGRNMLVIISDIPQFCDDTDTDVPCPLGLFRIFFGNGNHFID